MGLAKDEKAVFYAIRQLKPNRGSDLINWNKNRFATEFTEATEKNNSKGEEWRCMSH